MDFRLSWTSSRQYDGSWRMNDKMHWTAKRGCRARLRPCRRRLLQSTRSTWKLSNELSFSRKRKKHADGANRIRRGIRRRSQPRDQVRSQHSNGLIGPVPRTSPSPNLKAGQKRTEEMNKIARLERRNKGAAMIQHIATLQPSSREHPRKPYKRTVRHCVEFSKVSPVQVFRPKPGFGGTRRSRASFDPGNRTIGR